MDRRLIIYGDIHGCYYEFVSLRKKINPSQNEIEVCVGDIITRGEYSLKVLRYIKKNNIQSAIGNHEDKIKRYLNHKKLGERNPVILDRDENKIVNELNESDINFINNMPTFIKHGKVVILHGGLQNNFDLKKLSKKERSRILRLRYLTKNNKFIPYGNENSESIFWSDIYDGGQGFVVYGHQVFDNVKVNKNSLGIDTGCVYGNKLSAVVFEDVNNPCSYNVFDIKKSNNLITS